MTAAAIRTITEAEKLAASIGHVLTDAELLAAARRARRKERAALARHIREDAKVQGKRKIAAYRAVALIHLAHAGRNERPEGAPLAPTRRLRKAVTAFSRLGSVSLQSTGSRRQRRLEWALAGHNRKSWKAAR